MRLGCRCFAALVALGAMLAFAVLMAGGSADAVTKPRPTQALYYAGRGSGTAPFIDVRRRNSLSAWPARSPAQRGPRSRE